MCVWKQYNIHLQVSVTSELYNDSNMFENHNISLCHSCCFLFWLIFYQRTTKHIAMHFTSKRMAVILIVYMYIKQ